MTPQELSAKTGEVIGTSDWFHVTQERINLFADATGDHQFIHIDEEKAKLTPFGGTIAHGFLTLSLLPVLGAMTEGGRVSGVKMGVNYGGNKTRFISPVRAGKRVTVLTTVKTPASGPLTEAIPAGVEVIEIDWLGRAHGALPQQPVTPVVAVSSGMGRIKTLVMNLFGQALDPRLTFAFALLAGVLGTG